MNAGWEPRAARRAVEATSSRFERFELVPASDTGECVMLSTIPAYEPDLRKRFLKGRQTRLCSISQHFGVDFPMLMGRIGRIDSSAKRPRTRPGESLACSEVENS